MNDNQDQTVKWDRLRTVIHEFSVEYSTIRDIQQEGG